MKELLVRNFASPNKRKREFLTSEYRHQNGINQRIEKKTIYKVKEILQFTDCFDLELFLKRKKQEILPQTFIVRSCKKEEGQIKIVRKTISEVYAILDDRIFVIQVSYRAKTTITITPAL